MERLIPSAKDWVDKFIHPSQRLGATVLDDGVHILLWAPYLDKVEIEWIGKDKIALSKHDSGYFSGHFPMAKEGDRYFFHSGDKKFPDPASRFQPEGVFGPSQVTGLEYTWTENNYIPPDISEWVIYEIHTGTYSPSHDFQGIIDDLPRLKDLGVNVIEIMPISQFSGDRNWGYDGVFPHAVQNSYGGPHGLKKLVDACHTHGIAIILDVVYNHIGPEGNVLFACGPYTQTRYKTPWGDALNYDGCQSDHVRRYFLQTVWQWLTEYRFDGLRLDAVQTILDTSPLSFLQELTLLKEEAEKFTGRKMVITAETDMNDVKLLEPVALNGIGFDAQWADDLHHAIHVTLTGEKTGYYEDYGGAEQIARIYKQGIAYNGIYSPFHGRRQGSSYDHIDRKRLIVETQNHDQVGNRLMGERLSRLVDFEKLKLAAGCVLLSPSLPFLFMGEEYAAETPFYYFISHHDEKLLDAVRNGRHEEWKSFNWQGEVPDPSDKGLFDACVLEDKSSDKGKRCAMFAYYKELISLSKTLRQCDYDVEYISENNIIVLSYRHKEFEVIAALSFDENIVDYILPQGNEWDVVLKSEDFTDCTYRSAHERVANANLHPFSASVFRRAKK